MQSVQWSPLVTCEVNILLVRPEALLNLLPSPVKQLSLMPLQLHSLQNTKVGVAYWIAIFCHCLLTPPIPDRDLSCILAN